MTRALALATFAFAAALCAPRAADASRIDMTSWLLTGTDKVKIPKIPVIRTTVDESAVMNFTVNPSAQFFCPAPSAFLSGTCLDDKPKGPRHFKLTIDQAAADANATRLSNLLVTERGASNVSVTGTTVKVSGSYDKAKQHIVFNVKTVMKATATIGGAQKSVKVKDTGRYEGDRLN